MECSLYFCCSEPTLKLSYSAYRLFPSQSRKSTRSCWRTPNVSKWISSLPAHEVKARFHSNAIDCVACVPLRKRKPQETQALALASSQSWLPLLRPNIPIDWRLRLLREMIGCFLAVFVYATHAIEWKPGFRHSSLQSQYLCRLFYFMTYLDCLYFTNVSTVS